MDILVRVQPQTSFLMAQKLLQMMLHMSTETRIWPMMETKMRIASLDHVQGDFILIWTTETNIWPLMDRKKCISPSGSLISIAETRRWLVVDTNMRISQSYNVSDDYNSSEFNPSH